MAVKADSTKSNLNTALIKQALSAKLANKRQSTSHTKNRSAVSGGGRKPWRQKGTGRARAGSNRSPIWVGGGVTFGPTSERNFKHILPKKMNKRALMELLKHLQTEKLLVIVDSLSLSDAKTKLALELLKKHNLTGKKVAFVTEKLEVELVLAARNIPGVKVVMASNLSVADMASGNVLMEKKIAENLGLIKSDHSSVKKAVSKKGTN